MGGDHAHHGHDHGHSHGFKIPDWRSYKVDNAPELVQLKTALAQKGLKDPWLRYRLENFHSPEIFRKSCLGMKCGVLSDKNGELSLRGGG